MLLSCRPLRIIGFAAKGSGKPKVVCIDVRESPTEAIGQKWRLRRYLDAQDAIRDFFFSPSFHVLSDLNGRKLLKRLDQEVL